MFISSLLVVALKCMNKPQKSCQYTAAVHGCCISNWCNTGSMQPTFFFKKVNQSQNVQWNMVLQKQGETAKSKLKINISGCGSGYLV